MKKVDLICIQIINLDSWNLISDAFNLDFFVADLLVSHFSLLQ